MNLVAVFVASEIIVVFPRVSEDVHQGGVVAHEVIGDVDEDTHALRGVIPDGINEAGVTAVIPIVGHLFWIYNYFVLVSIFAAIINNSNVICVSSRVLKAAPGMTALTLPAALLVVNEFIGRFTQLRQHVQ